MKKLCFILVSFLGFIFLLGAFSVPALAADTCQPACLAGEICSNGTCCPAGTAPGAVCLTNPLESNINSVPSLVGQVIKAVLGIIGAVALIIFVRAGGNYLFAYGNAEKISAATKSMLWAAVGIVIVFASYFLLNVIVRFLTGSL